MSSLLPILVVKSSLVLSLTFEEALADLGRNAEVIGYLQSEFDKHDPRVLGIRNASAFNGLHNDPVFRALIARIGPTAALKDS